MAGYEAYLKSSVKSTASLNVKAKILSATMKTLSSIGWMVAISAGIKAISWAYKQISGKAAEEAKQKIKELGEEARNASDEIKSNFESTKSTVDRCGKEIC